MARLMKQAAMMEMKPPLEKPKMMRNASVPPVVVAPSLWGVGKSVAEQ